jgi:adenylate cyclase
MVTNSEPQPVPPGTADGKAAPSSRRTPLPNPGEIDLSLPDKPSIAVLPFANASGNAGLDDFCDGVCEDIINELSRDPALFVIARNSSFAYRASEGQAARASRELGVRHVLEGSILRQGDQLQVAVRLSDAADPVWSVRLERKAEEVFELQAELAHGVAAVLAPHADTPRPAPGRRARPGSLRAYDIAVRARNGLNRSYARPDRALRTHAISTARSALAADSHSVLGLTQLAAGLWQDYFLGTAPDKAHARREGLLTAARAIELDPLCHEGHLYRGMFLAASRGDGRPEQALNDCRAAHELNPNHFFTQYMLAWVEALDGHHGVGLTHVLSALRRNPRDPWAFNVHATPANICFFLKDYEMGLRWAQRAVAEAPHALPYHDLALCHVGLGQIDEAAQALDQARRHAPEFIDAALAGKSVFKKVEDRHKYHLFLRVAAGLERPGAASALR